MTAYIRGMAQLEAKLLKLIAAAPAIADEAVDVYADGIAEDARSLAPVDTGTLRDSIEVTDEGVEAGADYAAYVEFGTNDTPSQPFLRPAADTADVHTPEAAARARIALEAII